MLSKKSPNNNETKYDYDKNSSLLRSTQPDGGVTRIVYDLAGYKLLEVSPEQYDETQDNLVTNAYTGQLGTKYEWKDNKTVINSILTTYFILELRAIYGFTDHLPHTQLVIPITYTRAATTPALPGVVLCQWSLATTCL